MFGCQNRNGSSAIENLGSHTNTVTILMHKALMAAFGDGSDQVRVRHVQRAIADTTDARRDVIRSVPRRRWLFGGLGLLSLLGLVSLYVADVWAVLP